MKSWSKTTKIPWAGTAGALAKYSQTVHSVLFGGSGGAHSADLTKSRKISRPSGLDLLDGATVLIVRGYNKIDLPSGSGLNLKLLKDFEVANSL
jgi:hypothetical protein